jgi:hypothetical protein
MKRSSLRVLTVVLASITLAACKNGNNNAYDTNGIGAGSAAGQVPPGGVTPGAATSAPVDTSAAARATPDSTSARADTTRATAKRRPKRP